MSLLSWFRARNQAASETLAGHLPHTRVNIFTGFEDLVVDLMSKPDVSLVVDMGAGNFSPYAVRRPLNADTRLVGVDISEDAMARNNDVDEKIVADITQRLPFDDEEIDMVLSRSVLEHLGSVNAFVAESHRVTKEHGYAVHLFTGRFAWFALINRFLNHRFARRILYAVHPDSRQKGGFPALYDRCYFTAIKKTFADNGFEILEVRLSYGTNYTYFFLPLFLLVSVYEMVLQALRLRNCAATLVLVARRI